MTTKKTVVHDLQIVRGETIQFPESMSPAQILDWAKNYYIQQETYVNLNERIDAFPWDGAYAFVTAVKEQFGTADLAAEGNTISIAISPTETARVPFNCEFKLAGVEGYVVPSASYDDKGMVCFCLNGEVKQKEMPKIIKLAARVRELTRTQSIYAGQVIRVRFRKDDGKPLEIPQVSFVDVSTVNETELVYSEATGRRIRSHLFDEIQFAAVHRALGIPAKRTILLGGVFGVGKSLTAAVASKYAAAKGMVSIYLDRASELTDAVHFMKRYGGGMVFVEDIDRATNGGRSVTLDELLNTSDGIDSKGMALIQLFTTNDAAAINPAMIRNGRVDQLITITPPDAGAREKLLRQYGRGLIPANAILTPVVERLDGAIPALIREVIESSKALEASLRLANGVLPEVVIGSITNGTFTVSVDAMLLAIDDLQEHKLLSERRANPALTGAELMQRGMSSIVGDVLAESLAPQVLRPATRLAAPTTR